jgi:hypothetical protein
MKTKPRRGLQDMPTHSSLTSEAENPQRRFLRVATLELRKSLCKKMRDVARTRVAEMERKIAELELEESRLLAGAQVAHPAQQPVRAVPSVTSDLGSTGRRGLTLKY